MTIATECPRASLYYRSGSSDKEYHVGIEPSGPGFVVNFAYGRRGNTLQTGTKTSSPVGFDEAQTIYDKLVKEKTAKGYTTGETGTPYQHTAKEERSTGVLPQLLNPIDEAECEHLLAEPAWWAQEKLDGKRVLIRRKLDEIVGINRSGLIIDLPTSIAAAAQNLTSRQFILDGECIGDRYIAFDLLEQACVDLKNQPYAQRLKALDKLVTAGSAIGVIETAMTVSAKRKLFEKLKAEKREGIVLKHHFAPYTPGRPASGGHQLKCKFTASASCIVAGANGRRRSVKLELIDAAGQRVGVGSITIPPNHTVPMAGQIIEARYLYAYPGGSLYQPVYLGVRDDLCAAECKVSQLKFKSDDDSET
jgi:bifunctional non-homologous end joining protein LigD